MKNTRLRLCIPLTALILLAACSSAPLPRKEPDRANRSPDFTTTAQISAGLEHSASILPDSVLNSYYKGQTLPAFDYFQKSRIQRFLAMWVLEETKDIENPQWNLDSFTTVTILDHDLQESRPDEQLYGCTFSDGADRYGYIIVFYDASGPALSNLGVTETTPCQYDLRANLAQISTELMETDIDLSTAQASRVYLYDRVNKRADQVIRFTDSKGDNYICDLDDPSFEIKKW